MDSPNLPVDVIAYLVESTERMASRMVNDLYAIPDGRENQSPGGRARPPVHIVAECALINGMVATFLTTGTVNRPKPEEREALLVSYDTKEKAREFLTQETERLIAAIKNTNPETLGEEAHFFPTRKATRYSIASLPAMHMSYHDGQLCYVQTLYGDVESHW